MQLILHTVRNTCKSSTLQLFGLLVKLYQVAYRGVHTLIHKGVNHLGLAYNSPVLPVFVKQQDHVKALGNE